MGQIQWGGVKALILDGLVGKTGYEKKRCTGGRQSESS